MDIFSPIEYLNRAMDATSLRVQVLANDAAHANDASYRPQTVSFEDRMQDALDEMDNGETLEEQNEGADTANTLQAEVQTAPVGTRYDMNQGMANLSKAQIMYQAMTSRAGGYLSALKYVVDNSGH